MASISRSNARRSSGVRTTRLITALKVSPFRFTRLSRRYASRSMEIVLFATCSSQAPNPCKFSVGGFRPCSQEASIFLSSRRITFPVGFRGSISTQRTSSGTLYPASRLRHHCSTSF